MGGVEVSVFVEVSVGIGVDAKVGVFVRVAVAVEVGARVVMINCGAFVPDSREERLRAREPGVDMPKLNMPSLVI